MEKEIKFRGKRIDNNEWVYGIPYKDSKGKTFILWEEHKAMPGPGGHGEVLSFVHDKSLLLKMPAFEVKEETVVEV